MAKVSNEARTKYFEKIKEYKKQIENTLTQEKQILAVISSGAPGAEYQRISLAEENLSIVSNCLVMNELSVSLLGIKNENFLNEARKACYKIVIYLEDVFTDSLDAPYSDYQENVESVKDYPELDRFALIRILGFSIEMVRKGFGDNSKWKWSIIELEGRLATLSKNVIDMKRFIAGMDPRSKGFRERVEHFRLSCKLLQKAADSYRLKYELTTNRMDDFKIAINFLSALRRFYVMANQKREAEELKKKIEIWKQKMESDARNSEDEERKKRLTRS